jgi:hypothetical protein
VLDCFPGFPFAGLVELLAEDCVEALFFFLEGLRFAVSAGREALSDGLDFFPERAEDGLLDFFFRVPAFRDALYAASPADSFRFFFFIHSFPFWC